MMMNAVPHTMIGRVQAVMETVMFGTSLVSIVLTGLVGQFVPVWIIFAVSGTVMALAGLFGWFAFPKGTTSQKSKMQTASDETTV